MLLNNDNIEISVVVPMYNEEPNIDYLIMRLVSIFAIFILFIF